MENSTETFNSDDSGKNHIKQLGSGDTEMKFTLPAWRMNEIVDFAAKILCEAKFYSEDFSYRKMISDGGITVKGYSQFLPENLEKMRVFSPSFWSEGLCLVLPPDENFADGIKMICYNDSYKNGEEAVVILHELGHILLKHTEQSMNGEAEAICFAATAMILISLEKRFHFVKKMEDGEIKYDLTHFEKEFREAV